MELKQSDPARDSLPPGFTVDPAQAALPAGFSIDSENQPSQPSSGVTGSWTPDTGVVASVKRNLYGLVHSPIDIANTIKQSYDESGQGGMPGLDRISETALRTGKKLLLDPQIGRAQQALAQLHAGNYGSAAAQGLMAATPVVGPQVGAIVDRAGHDMPGAITDALMQGVAIPAAGKGLGEVAQRAAPMLQESAAGQLVRALQPTTNENKVRAQRFANEIVQRPLDMPVALTQQGLANKLAKQTEVTGQALENRLAQVPPTSLVNVDPVKAAIDKSVWDNKAMISGPNGPVVANKPMVDAAEGLKSLVDDLSAQYLNTQNPMLSRQTFFDAANGLRQSWDKFVKKSKGFTTPDVNDLAELKRDGASALRTQLAKAEPDIPAFNAEFSLWKNGSDVIEATMKRKAGQSVPMGEQLATAAGAAGGLATAGPMAAVEGAAVMRTLVKTMRSTGWKTVSAATKASLAKALMDGPSAYLNLLVMKAAGEAARGATDEEPSGAGRMGVPLIGAPQQ